MPVIVRDPLDPEASHWHFLAYMIRHFREREGLSLTQLGQILDVARSTVSNFESGRRKLGTDYAAQLDERFGTGLLFRTLHFYACTAHDPDWARAVADYELRARVVKIYHGQLIPIPFQTEETVRALLSSARTVSDVDAAVTARMARQAAMLDRADPLYIWALLEEAVLEQQTGGPAALRAQLAHLHELSLRNTIGVRVIPKTVGSHIGADGPVRFLSLDERDVAYVGAWRGGRMIESPAEVREVALDWDFISQKALSDEDTRKLIRQKMEALS
ncbi:hypothetical protein GCM10022221_42240 [Actinocorallia aurea]